MEEEVKEGGSAEAEFYNAKSNLKTEGNERPT
jgi:hypothetical protein